MHSVRERLMQKAYHIGLLLLVGAGGAALVLSVTHGPSVSAPERTGAPPRPASVIPSVHAPTVAARAGEAAEPSPDESTLGSEIVMFLETVAGGDSARLDPRVAERDATSSDTASAVARFERAITAPATLAAPPREADGRDLAASTEQRREPYPEPASTDALETLATASRLECNFAEGRGWWGSMESLAPAEADYRGNPIVYHAIDLATGKARMTGTLGVTGSREGEIDARVTATPLGLYFSHVEPTGRLAVTAVLAHLRRDDVFPAVFSQYGSVDTYLYRGACGFLILR
jgi:hypothetical protein